MKECKKGSLVKINLGDHTIVWCKVLCVDEGRVHAIIDNTRAENLELIGKNIHFLESEVMAIK